MEAKAGTPESLFFCGSKKCLQMNSIFIRIPEQSFCFPIDSTSGGGDDFLKNGEQLSSIQYAFVL